MARRQLKAEAPYAQSRAALREIYGSRAIDARAPQSALDSTPSGRLRYLQQQGASEADAIQSIAQDFQNNFQPRTAFVAPRPMAAQPANPAFAAPSTILRDRAMGAAVGSYQTPYGQVGFTTPAAEGTALSFDLSTPSPLAATDLAPFTPPAPVAAYVPPWRRKQQQGGYMSSILGDVGKWLT